MKFKVGQKVRVIATGQAYSIAWVDLFGGQFYRLDNDYLYTEEELEPVED